MSEIETIEEPVEPALPIEVICTGECPSLSARSTLTFAIARNVEDGQLYLSITGNSGGGMFAKRWASATAIDAIALGANELTAKSFNALHPGRSTNTGGFCLAALRTLGLVQLREDNARFHAHRPTATFEAVASAYIAQAKAVKLESGGRKTLRLKAKEI